jgi:hypothetical protein
LIGAATTEFPDAAGDLRNLVRGMRPRVARVGDQLVDRRHADRRLEDGDLGHLSLIGGKSTAEAVYTRRSAGAISAWLSGVLPPAACGGGRPELCSKRT